MRMKIIASQFLATMFLLMMSATAMAGDNVLSSKGGAFEGETLLLSIELNNEDSVIGIQFDLKLPEGLSIEENDKGKCMYKASKRLDGMSVIARKLGAGHYRFLAFSLQCKPVAGSTGAIMDIPLKREASLTAGDYEVKAEGVSLSTMNSGSNMNYIHNDFTIPVAVK